MGMNVEDNNAKNYFEIAKTIENHEINTLLISVLNKQKNILSRAEKVMHLEDNTYILLFKRYYTIFHTIIDISNSKSHISDIAAINILIRSTIELSSLLYYLLIPGFIKCANEEDERKLKLHVYMLNGFESKRYEFGLMDNAGIKENNCYVEYILTNISRLRNEIATNNAYKLLSKNAQKEIDKPNKNFITNEGCLSFKKLIEKIFVNKFISIQYIYLCGFTHTGYQSFVFQKHAEFIDEHRLMLLYFSCSSLFLTLRYYFKIDTNCFSDREVAILLEFVAMGLKDNLSSKK